ncbi:hypothetical protein [Pseudactinotalea suaedae]|uniref:hypothetical protein n=1 Tax=Pseudactinotalea suaedae TaxID=1524924 RepID=UPI0012E1445A|nr:hypothetical protein [Pseudactinotalea suaedae]
MDEPVKSNVSDVIVTGTKSLSTSRASPDGEPTPALTAAVPPIRIRGMRLIGPRRNYTVDFTDDAHVARQLAVIAGEISTGKTSILELIDYCLGAKDYPDHDEIIANVRAAQLSIEVREAVGGPGADDEQQVAQTTYQAVRYIIERPIGSVSKVAWLFHGDLDAIPDLPRRRLTLDPADPDSLSQFLLGVCGLGGLRVKSAPTQEESSTSILSFRDVMPLWFLTNRRMDNADLVLEKQPHRLLKIRQVVDYMFGVGDEESSEVAEQIESLRSDIRTGEAGIRALHSFLDDAGLGDLESIDVESDSERVSLAEARAELTNASARLTASTSFATQLRDEFGRATEATRRTEAELRDRQTLLRRLDPLRSQYADDLRKLEMLEESQQLFGSLAVVTCPACFSTLDDPPNVVNGHCSLCHSDLTAAAALDADDDASGDVPAVLDADSDAAGKEAPSEFSVAREQRSTRRRLEQLKGFIGEVATEVRQLEEELNGEQRRVVRAQRALDDATSQTIAPFISERDAISGRVAASSARLDELARKRRMLQQLAQRENTLNQARAALQRALARQRELERTRLPRDAMVDRLSRRFSATLAALGYPKLDNAYLRKDLVPVVRGKLYHRVGSSGAMTLVALAWQLTVFETALEEGHGHPGFLLIDSPQKNLRRGSRPRDIVRNAGGDAGDAGDAGGDDDAIAAQSTTIVDRIYGHLSTWLGEHPEAQIIMVDNEPPTRAAGCVVVEYSANPGSPPYGLIDDEDGRAGPGDEQAIEDEST